MHKDLKMPPARRLHDSEIATLENWIKSGAPWTRSAVVLPKARFWSLTSPARPQLPPVANEPWILNPIDRFILARLEQEKIQPSPAADDATLLRRLSLDTTGLPPESDSDSYPAAVERFLASPHFGERWARHWLDQARYADSDGGSRDEPRQVWRYRDWVINAINSNLPFDRFLTEQLAGDLLPNATLEQITATGFLRHHQIQIEAGTDREQYRVESVFDRVDTVGSVVLGLSLGCARCHDHKFDPISQRNYYEFFAFFNNADEWDNSKSGYLADRNLYLIHSPTLDFGAKDQVAKLHALRAQVSALENELAEFQKNRKDPEGVKVRQATINSLYKQMPKLDSTMVFRERAAPRESYLFQGGDFLRRGPAVQPGVPAAILSAPPMKSRLDLAAWVTHRDNPLTARVAVNRIWQQYFGKGLVETENDFGTQGALPTHPELLDWLAAEFIESKWDVKRIHRLILNSATYRQSSQRRADLEKADPDNRLVARQHRLRLEAEIVRDSGLAASGLLTRKIGGPSVFPPQPANAMSASQLKKTWPTSTGEDRYRRGLYTFFYRITPHPALTVFDQPNATQACTRRNRSNTPLQALTLLNDQAYHEFAQAFATRILREAPPTDSDRLDHAFRRSVSRPPSASERDRLLRLLHLERDEFSTKPEEAKLLTGKPDPDLAAWTALSRVLLNTDEFITRE